jgi:hypothetical protein
MCSWGCHLEFDETEYRKKTRWEQRNWQKILNVEKIDCRSAKYNDALLNRLDRI